MAIAVEQLAIDALRDWLLQQLPVKVPTVNALRAAILRAPIVGPYTVPVGANLFHSSTAVDGTFTTVGGFTSGSRTAAQIAIEFNNTVPGVASADSSGRLLFTAAAAPVVGTDSLVALGPDSTGMMAALGFDAGGERTIRSALVAPGPKGIYDGTPLAPDGGPGFWIILGDNMSVPVEPAVRRDEYLVAVNCTVMVPVPSSSQSTREHLRAAVRCVREVLFLTAGGRTLGSAAGVQLVTERQAVFKSRPIIFNELPNALFCRAALELNVRVFERQGD